MQEIKFLPAGDCAIVAEFGNAVDIEINKKVHALAAKISKRQIKGVTELLPTFRSLMIYYNPRQTSFADIKKEIVSLENIENSAGSEKKKILKIPCCYGARFGCDLAYMENHTGLDREEIIKIHSASDYKIYMMGFLPGFVYLGGLDKRLEMPRLKTPRIKIQAGAVGIGGNQTGVYPLTSPGGWRLMGATPVDFYDPKREKPVLCAAGEYIRFVPITIGEYYDIRHMAVKGNYEVEIVEEGGEAWQ